MRTARKFFYRASNPRMKKNASEQELLPFPRRSLFFDASVYRNGIFPVSWRRTIRPQKVLSAVLRQGPVRSANYSLNQIFQLRTKSTDF